MSFERGKDRSEIISALLDAEIRGENPSARLAELLRLVSESDARGRRLEASLAVHTEVTATYLSELFRESRTSLYRLESIVMDMPDPGEVRRLVNEFVRSHEREMEERLAEIRQRIAPRS